MKKQRSGSVLIITLMMLSAIVLLTEKLITSVRVGSLFTKTMVYREHAEMLALGGINLAITQLTVDMTDKEDKKGSKPEEKEEETGEEKSEKSEGKGAKKKDSKKYVAKLLPSLNRWQEFKLQESVDGIDGLIKMCITCENGKININEAFDFKKQEFKKDISSLLKKLEISGMLAPGELFTRFTEYFKKRNRKLDDITELSEIPGINKLDIFYNPPEKAEKKGKKSEPNKIIALQDLFTIWTDEGTINPLWFSDAVCAIFGLRRPLADDPRLRQESFKQFLGMFKENMTSDWEANWKTLEPLYEEKPKILPEIKNLFSKEFWPKVFSVLSYGKVGHVEQAVLAIVKEVEEAPDTADKEEKKGENEAEKEKEAVGAESKDKKPGESKKFFKILRIYWI